MLNKDKIKEEFEKFLEDKKNYHRCGLHCGEYCMGTCIVDTDKIFAHLSAQYEKLIEEVIGKYEKEIIPTPDNGGLTDAFERIGRNQFRSLIRTSLQERGIMIK